MKLNWLQDTSQINDYENSYHQKSNAINLAHSVYPNPTKGQLTITFTEELETIKVFDYKGVQHFEKNVKGLGQVEIDLTDLANGSYLIIASNQEEVVFTEQVIKQ